MKTVDEPESPSFSPDGSTIVFDALRGGVGDIFAIDLKTKEITNLTNDKFADAGPVYSPDGRFIGTCDATPQQCDAALRFLGRHFTSVDRTAGSELGFGRIDWRPSTIGASGGITVAWSAYIPATASASPLLKAAMKRAFIRSTASPASLARAACASGSQRSVAATMAMRGRETKSRRRNPSGSFTPKQRLCASASTRRASTDKVGGMP